MLDTERKSSRLQVLNTEGDRTEGTRRPDIVENVSAVTCLSGYVFQPSHG